MESSLRYLAEGFIEDIVSNGVCSLKRSGIKGKKWRRHWLKKFETKSIGFVEINGIEVISFLPQVAATKEELEKLLINGICLGFVIPNTFDSKKGERVREEFKAKLIKEWAKAINEGS